MRTISRQGLGLLACVLIAAILIHRPALAQAPRKSDFADWKALVIAGDWHAHSGAPSEVFDNARRDIAKSLVKAGFQASNVTEFSVRPERYAAARVFSTELKGVSDTLSQAQYGGSEGCLIYLTSHGNPAGIVFGNRMLTPAMLAGLLDRTCGQKPTIAIVSACFSGVFVEPLIRPNRMVITAARGDRASFGCGETDVYTYFDNCVLSQMGEAQDFVRLASQVQTCIAVREQITGVSPASEPQVYIGPQLRPVLALLQLDRRSPQTAQR